MKSLLNLQHSFSAIACAIGHQSGREQARARAGRRRRRRGRRRRGHHRRRDFTKGTEKFSHKNRKGENLTFRTKEV